MIKKLWIITDWGGGIKHPSASVFDTKKDALKELASFEKMPDPIKKGKKMRVVKAELRWCENVEDEHQEIIEIIKNIDFYGWGQSSQDLIKKKILETLEK